MIHGQQALLDCDVAELYGVETKRVNEAVRNNPSKFPEGYVIDLSIEKSGRGHYSKYNFKAFTERGLYMLATILKSPNATAATIAII